MSVPQGQSREGLMPAVCGSSEPKAHEAATATSVAVAESLLRPACSWAEGGGSMYSQATVSRANSPWSGLSFRQSWEAGGSMLKATVRKVIGRGWSGA